MRNHLKFSLPEEYNQQQLTGAFADHYVVKKESTRAEEHGDLRYV